MAFDVAGDDGVLNGVTPVTLVAAPGAGVERTIPEKGISVYNADTATVTLSVRKVSAGGTRVIDTVTLLTGEKYSNDTKIVLDAATDSVTAVLSGAPATTQPDWCVSWGDSS